MERDEAIELIKNSPLAEYAEALSSHLRSSARIKVCDETDERAPLSLSYFGGQPSLPVGTAWPCWDKREHIKAEIASIEERLDTFSKKTLDQPERVPGSGEKKLKRFHDTIAKKREELSLGSIPLAFLGQISLHQLSAIAPLHGWPREGVLAFFYDPAQIWGYDPLDRGHCQVLFFPEDAPLTPTEFPTDLAANARFPKRTLEFRCEWTLPTDPELKNGDLPLSNMDEYSDLISKLNSSDDKKERLIHRVGGYPQEVQGDMRLECQLVTNGLYCGNRSGYEDPRRKELEAGASDWQLLAQFDSDEKLLGWMWGDIGRVYFWARRQEIETADFSNCWAILQCG